MRVEQAAASMVEVFVCEDVVLGMSSYGIVHYLILKHRPREVSRYPVVPIS